VLAAREELAGAELAVRDAWIAALAAQVEELRRRLDKDSSTSSGPPSSDGPYRKPRDQSLRTKTGRRPGRQLGAQSWTLRQSGNPVRRGKRRLIPDFPVMPAHGRRPRPEAGTDHAAAV
jgi:transposase